MKFEDITMLKRIRKIELGSGMRGLMAKAAYILCGFISAKASIFGSYAPFGISAVAAVPFTNTVFVFLGALAGYAVFPTKSSFRYIVAMIAVIAIRWTLSEFKKLNRHFLFSSIIAFLPAMATGLAMMSTTGFYYDKIAIYTLEAFLSATAAYFISRTVFIINGTKSIGMMTPQELACLTMSACIGLLALSGINIWIISIGRILAVIIILFFARYGGVSGGAVAGIAMGIVLGMTSSQYFFLGASYAFGGLMAGLFAPLGRVAAAAGFMLCCIMVSLRSAQPEIIIGCFYEMTVAAVIFILLPKHTASFLRGIFMTGDPSDSFTGLRKSIIMRLSFAARALSNVSEEVEEVSEKLEKIVTPTMDEVYNEAIENTCSRCGMRVFCWEHRDGVSMESLQYANDTLKKNGEIKAEDFSVDFKRKCCRANEMAKAVNKCYDRYLASQAAEKRIEEVRMVVAGQFCGLGDILNEMAEEYAEYEIFDGDLESQIGIKLKELDLTPISVSCRADNTGRMTIEAEIEDVPKNYIKKALLLREVSKICGRNLDIPCITSAYGVMRISLCERAYFDVEIAGSQHICGDGRLCGDHLTYFTDGTGRLTAIISDGMGTGGRAAVDGGMASGLMEKLIKAGLGYDCSLKVVNSALLVKSGDESLATLDIVSVDLYTGKTEFMKAGAAISFIRKSGDMYHVETPSIPVGILPQAEFMCTEDELSEGDIIVMVSDGAVATGEEWIERMIMCSRDQSMQQLADSIIDEAIARRNDGRDDDITVIAMKIIRA